MEFKEEQFKEVIGMSNITKSIEIIPESKTKAKSVQLKRMFINNRLKEKKKDYQKQISLK